KEAGLSRAQIVVSDPDFDRAGALPFEIVAAPSKGAPLITLEDAGVALAADPKDKAPRRLTRASADAPLPASELYLALFPRAAKASQEVIPRVSIEAEGGTLGDLVAVLDGLRFWRKLEPGATGAAVTRVDPQDAGGVP